MQKQAARKQQERLAARLRSRYLGATTEAFADELDALRRTDATFKGAVMDFGGWLWWMGSLFACMDGLIDW
jgi:hypothetical protein